MTTSKQAAIIQALKHDPMLSNRQIAKQVGCHHVSVGTARTKLENAGELLRRNTVTGGDGKTYSKAKTSRPKATKAKANKPVSMDGLVSKAMAGLLRQARKDGGLEELADAFRRYYAAHLAMPQIMPDVPVAIEVADPPSVTAKPQEPAREQSQSDASPAPKVRDVARDITPDADNEDYGDLPTEERIALYEDQAAVQRHPDAPTPLTAALTSAPEGQWMVGEVVYINQFTQCGRVCLPDFGDVQFSDRTPRAAGLKLQQGQEVECRFVMRHGHPWVVEFAKAHVAA